ncbi:MAG: enolase C-terminal domain-like protein, partial [Hyphomicrobiales bacterium]
MPSNDLTFAGLRCRILNVPLNRPIISRVGAFEKWAFICLDIETKGGITGRSYLAPYLIDYAPAIVHCIEMLAAPMRGQSIAPANFYDDAMKRISLIGKSGIALYALAALDMALWDAHAQAAGAPLAVHLGGTIEPVKAYNSRGLWLSPVEELPSEAELLVKEGGFDAVKMRFGRAEMMEDIAAAAAVREAVGEDVAVMSDFNQGLTFSEALHWMHALDDAGLYWFE